MYGHYEAYRENKNKKKMFAGSCARLYKQWQWHLTWKVRKYTWNARWSTALMVSKNTHCVQLSPFCRGSQHACFVMMRWCRHSGTRIKHGLTCLDKWNQASSLKNATQEARKYTQYRRHSHFLSRIVRSSTDNLCVVVQTYFRRSLCWWIWVVSVWLDVMQSRNIHYSVLCWYSWPHRSRRASNCTGFPDLRSPTTLCRHFLSSEMLHIVASNVTHPDISKERSAVIFRVVGGGALQYYGTAFSKRRSIITFWILPVKFTYHQV